MITRESDYAIRIIRALKDGELLPLEQICQRELVPKQFAYKILKKLERSGLVSIRRGAGGGCILNRSLADLTHPDDKPPRFISRIHLLVHLLHQRPRYGKPKSGRSW